MNHEETTKLTRTLHELIEHSSRNPRNNLELIHKSLKARVIAALTYLPMQGITLTQFAAAFSFWDYVLANHSDELPEFGLGHIKKYFYYVGILYESSDFTEALHQAISEDEELEYLFYSWLKHNVAISRDFPRKRYHGDGP